MKLVNHIIIHVNELIRDNENKSDLKLLATLNEIRDNLYKIQTDVHTEINLNGE